MKKELVYIENDKVAIVDEKGKITLRENKGNISNLLKYEDKMDLLNKKIEGIKKNIKMEEQTIDLIDKWFKIVVSLSAGFLVAAPIALGLFDGLGLFIVWCIFSGSSCLYGGKVQEDSKKRINGYNYEIDKVEELKNDVQKELDITKELKNAFGNEREEAGKIEKIDTSDDIILQNRRLYSAFKKGYEEEPKVYTKTLLDKKRY